MMHWLQQSVATFNIWIAIGLFVAYLIIDALFAIYTQAVIKNQPLKAAKVSLIFYFVSALGVIGYVHNYLYVIPVTLGSWVGTYFIVARAKARTQR